MDNKEKEREKRRGGELSPFSTSKSGMSIFTHRGIIIKDNHKGGGEKGKGKKGKGQNS